MKVVAQERSGAFARWMYRRGWRGVTIPLPGVVLVIYWTLPGVASEPETHIHEMVHVQQAKSLGVARFWWRYLTGWLRHGYQDHPMEVEARQVTTDRGLR